MSFKTWLASSLAAGAFTLASVGAYNFKKAQLDADTQIELNRRENNMYNFSRVTPNNQSCEQALSALKKPYIEDRESFLLLWQIATSFKHYKSEYVAVKNVCNEPERSTVDATKQGYPHIYFDPATKSFHPF